MSIGEALAAPDGHHASHMVNPALHPCGDDEPVVDLRAIQETFHAARIKEERESR